jgi:ParB-like chromosome segregation protein Spo0J
LVRSILTNGWTQPIVVTAKIVIIDGYHRWLVSGQEPLKSKLGGMVPIVVVEHEDKKDDIYGTITHNRARGTHLLEPMEAIVRSLLDKEIPIKEIAKQLGMKKEEIWRLSGLDREDFLNFIINERKYSKETVFTRA